MDFMTAQENLVREDNFGAVMNLPLVKKAKTKKKQEQIFATSQYERYAF